MAGGGIILKKFFLVSHIHNIGHKEKVKISSVGVFYL